MISLICRILKKKKGQTQKQEAEWWLPRAER